MKLTKQYFFLFLILLLAVFLYYSLGIFDTVEGMVNQINNKLSNNNNNYYNPQSDISGIPKRNIPPGQEDLYILKSNIVPPVCPVCPTIINKCTDKEKCPPCPPCGRCPEPSFECVKRPTYKAENSYLPVPVLSDFSSFGM